MQLFSEYVQWQGYAATEYAVAEVEEKRADALVRRIEAETLVLLNPEKGEVKKNLAARELDPRLAAARQEAINAYAKRKMTGVMHDNCEDFAALISRELSRRIGRTPVDRRQARWQP